MSSFNYTQIKHQSSVKQDHKNHKRSSSEDYSRSSTTNDNPPAKIDSRQRRNSVPLSLEQKAILEKKVNATQMGNNGAIPFEQSINKSKHTHHGSSSLRETQYETFDRANAQNQNYYGENHSHFNQILTDSNVQLLSNEKVPNDLMRLSHMNKHVSKTTAVHDKIIQCNDDDFHRSALSNKRSHIVLVIRLADRFVRTLFDKHKKYAKTPKLKVYFSSDLLDKLFQSSRSNSLTIQNSDKVKQLNIESKFGTITACIYHENMKQSTCIPTKAYHHEHRIPIIRHVMRTRSNDSGRRKETTERNHKYRRKKKLLQQLSSVTSYEELSSRGNSLNDDETQSIGTLSSSCQTHGSISIQKHNKTKKNKRN